MDNPQPTLKLLSSPKAEPVTVAEAKGWLRVDSEDEDDTVALLITAAREHAEAFCRRSFLVGEVWQAQYDHFPYPLRGDGFWYYGDYFNQFPSSYLYRTRRENRFALQIPNSPVSAINSVTYLDVDGDPQTLDASAYELVADDTGAYLYPAYQAIWPMSQFYPGAVTVNYTAGEPAPARLLLYIRQVLSHWFDNREAVVMQSGVVPQNVLLAGELLLWPLRNLTF